MKNKKIILIKNRIIDDELALKISKLNQKFCFGIDMRNVETINSDIFIGDLLSDKFKLFNLKSEVLTYLSLILKRGFLKSFMNRNDFFENKRELIRRKFIVIS